MLRAKLSRDKQAAQAGVGVKAEAFYGTQFLEFGTSRIAKRPWLTPALTTRRNEVMDRLKERLKDQIDKARKKQ